MADRKLDDWLTSYMKYTEDWNAEPPAIYRQWVGISTIASVLQRKCFVLWERPIYPNMFIILTGPSGRCRKGTAMRQGLDLIRGQGIKLAANSTTRESLIRQIRMAVDQHIAPEGKMEMHCSLTIFSEELTVFLGFGNKQLMSDLGDWYDCSPNWKYMTKNKGEDHIVNIWVNLIGATTPELVQSTMPRDAIGGGLTGRMIFVYAHHKGRTVVYPLKSPEGMELEKILSIDLEAISMLSGEFIPSIPFLEKYAPWYEEQDKNPAITDPRFSGYTERRSIHLRKLSMILCASRTDSKLIEGQDFDRALSILQNTERDMIRAFGGAGRSETSDIMFGVWTMIANAGQVMYSDILNTFKYDVTNDELQKIITTLIIMKKVNMENVEKDGHLVDQAIIYIGTDKHKQIEGSNNG